MSNLKQDCSLCFYKFAGDAKKTKGWCIKYSSYKPICSDYKNRIKINGKDYHFINPLDEPCLDKIK